MNVRPAAARLSAPLIALAVLLVASNARAADITIIQYDLSGVVNFTSQAAFSQPVYPSSAPGPGEVGSKVTFRFVPRPSSQVSVQVETFALSNGVTLLPVFTGYLRQTLLSPGVTGGHLVGSTAVGTGSGVANQYGFVHCLADAGFCSFVHGHTLLSYPIPQTRSGKAWFFAGRTRDGASGSGWVFNADFSTVQAVRPTRMGGRSYLVGTANLVGTEIGRTVQPVVEPQPWTLIVVSFIAMTSLLTRRTRARLSWT